MSLAANPEHVSFSIAGTSYEVVGLTGEERLSTLFRFELTCHIEGFPPGVAGLIGADAEITLRDGHKHERLVHGMVASARVRVSDADHSEMVVEVRPFPFGLTVGRDNRAFQRSTVVDIVREVVAPVRGTKRFELGRSYHNRPYTVQYREDDWTFATRMLEDEGIYYWFDHAEGSALVFGDDSTASPDAPGGATIAFAYETGMTTTAEVIAEIATSTRAAPTKFTVASFDFNRPMLKVTGSAGGGGYEHYDAPGGGPDDPGLCTTRAQTKLEAANAAREGYEGSSTSVRMFPGVCFQLVDHPMARLDGRYLVVGASYKVEQRRRNGAAERAYECVFHAIRARIPYRAPEELPRPQQLGAQTGIVIGEGGQEIHTDPLARVRVQQHWDRLGDRSAESGTWMRVSQRGSADSLLFPRIGWTVLTFNEEANVDSPSVFNRVPDAEHMPPYPLPENKTRLVFKTATTPGGGSFNEIRMEDKKGVEEMFINASRDMNILAQHIKNERVQRDQERTVGANHTLTVGTHQMAQVGRDQSISVGGNETLTVNAGRTADVDHNHKIKIGGTRKIDVGKEHILGTDQSRKLAVGAAMIDVSLGTIAADGGIYTMVAGGAVIKASAKTITEDVGKISVQLVGGVKMEKAKLNRATDVKKQFYETIGGGMTLDSGGTYVDNAQKLSSWKITGAMTAKAPSVHVEAKDKIVLRVGSSTITILPDSIEIKSPSFDLGGAGKLDYDAKTITHN
jgi:type VI secretion system secreted protein VgrG